MNGKAERVVRTLMEIWHNQQISEDSKNRKQKFKRFISYYNTIKSHQAISSKKPYEFLEGYFSHEM
ncbi:MULTISPECIES: integrase core domain-containing protein [Gilliamella]|uniref:integrase core domain-containing protein n=1 Tax=Gilliamella TaxID=1193503 RepID=UPI00342AE25B